MRKYSYMIGKYVIEKKLDWNEINANPNAIHYMGIFKFK